MNCAISESLGGVTIGLDCAIFVLQVDVGEDYVAAWKIVAALKVHGLLALRGPTYVLVYDLAYVHSRCLANQDGERIAQMLSIRVSLVGFS